MSVVTADGNNHLSGLTYDASGNTQSDGNYAYTWDGESQLKTAAGVTYSYDGDGRRVSKSSGKLYWYGSGGEILAETNTAGGTSAEYIFFGGKRIAMLPAAGNAQYYAEDLLGSSRVMVQSNGTLCYDADFTPFGAERAYTSTCAQGYKFEGKERDTETQNDDFGARYYSWRFGRWLSSDWSAVPVAVPYANLTNPQTLNLYAMVSDDPESFADLDGHLLNSSLGDNDAEQEAAYASGVEAAEGAPPGAPGAHKKAKKKKAQNQTGTVNVLGQNVPYTVAQGAPTTALGTLNKIVATINGAQDQLTPTQVTEIKAVKEVYIAAATSLQGAGGFSVTNQAVQQWASTHEHINVPIGTFVMSGASLSHASTGYWASSFVHEGVHMIHHEFGTPANERRAYFEQYRSMPPFHVTTGEGMFIKAECGANCY